MPKPVDVSTPSDREIRVARVFDAPAKLVWDCHTRPELIRRWMLGPPGWSMPVCEVDLTVGGAYRYRWRSDADGTEFGSSGFDGEAVNTLVFEESGGRTTATLTMLFASKEARDGALQSGMSDGMAMGYDRMDAILAELAAA
jgi:uncharacterized protein YndB with AHSA1/START domain